MERYWFTVFSEVFQGINIEPIKNMISFISRWENNKHTRRANFTIGDVMQFVENSEIIFMMVFVGIQWNNESAIESKQITKNWWNELYLGSWPVTSASAWQSLNQTLAAMSQT